MVRGGAPFLSAIDSKLLLSWLDKGVPVPLIIESIEEVAAKRTKSRITTPMNLNKVKSTVNRQLKRRLKPKSAKRSKKAELAKISAPSLFLELSQSIEPLQRMAGEKLIAINTDDENIINLVLQVAREFHEANWVQCNQAKLKSEAAEELEPFREAMSKDRWEQAVEEIARDTLRKKTPQLTAAILCEALSK
jgi:hypothetical protein